MTKCKAIEAAYRYARQTTGYVSAQITTVVDAIAGHAYELGRIAGLREAAKITDPPQDNPCIDLSEHIIAHKWLSETALQLRNHANKLAKKARRKCSP